MNFWAATTILLWLRAVGALRLPFMLEGAIEAAWPSAASAPAPLGNLSAPGHTVTSERADSRSLEYRPAGSRAFHRRKRTPPQGSTPVPAWAPGRDVGLENASLRTAPLDAGKRRLHCRWSRLPVSVLPWRPGACGLAGPRVEMKSPTLWQRPHRAHRPGHDDCTQAEGGPTYKPAPGITVTGRLVWRTNAHSTAH
jgi:hypothetical protein